MQAEMHRAHNTELAMPSISNDAMFNSGIHGVRWMVADILGYPES